MTERLVHFIYLGGEFLWQHWRAVETAKVHEAPIVLHHIPDADESFWDWIEQHDSPETWRWLTLTGNGLDGFAHVRDHPIDLANVKDYYAWKILHDQGGLYLDLDTISLRPAWDLLTREVCVSLEHEDGFDAGHAYNSAVVLGRRGAGPLIELRERARLVLESGESRWGKCGPHLLTDVVAAMPDRFDVAPFGALNGWRDDTIDRYYAGERPGPDVRVAHLFSSSRMDAFRADRWMP